MKDQNKVGVRIIDAREAHCPGPLLELVAAIKLSDKGQKVGILSCDEGSLNDIPIWVSKARHELVSVEDFENCKCFIVKKLR